MPSLQTLTSQHKRDLVQLTDLAESDLEIVWRTLGSGDPKMLLLDVLPDLVTLYGEAAASLGAEWFDEMREAAEVPGSFQGIAAELPDAGRAQALAGWATATGVESASVLALAQGGLQSIIAQVDRQSVQTSSVEDRRTKGWKRVGVGKCDFCKMLIGRGAVYREATASFETHDHCFCLAVPEFQ